jgi:hypothetical protein
MVVVEAEDEPHLVDRVLARSADGNRPVRALASLGDHYTVGRRESCADNTPGDDAGRVAP